jgi:ABC-type nitrate/sulfonate/bicarbonate transport system substrate-binding protein
MKTISIALDWFANTNHAGIYLALHNSYYRECGLDVVIHDGVTAGINSDADIIFAPQPSILTAINDGKQITAVATLTQRNDSGIISLKEAGRKSPGDLTGKRISRWSTPWFDCLIGKAVSDDGGDYSKVLFVQKDIANIHAALGKEIDAVWVYKGWEYFVMKQAGIDVNYFEFADYGNLYNYCAPCIATTHKLIESTPDLLESFLKQTAKGYKQAVANPDAAAEILAGYMKKADNNDIALVKESLHYISARFLDNQGNWGAITPERWNPLADYMLQQNIIKARTAKEYTSSSGF